MRVLLAERNPGVRKRLQTALATQGFDVVCVADGHAALEHLLCGDGPWIALLGPGLSGRSGLSVCREIHASARHPSLYIILRTESASSRAVARGLDAGADDSIATSCELGVFKARLRLAERTLRTRHALARRALHDSLTLLPNRAHVIQRLTDCARQMRLRPEHEFTLLLVNIDRFTIVNESLGHTAGDDLMKKIAQRLLQTVRTRSADAVGDDRRRERNRCEDTVARLDGDEFVIILEQAGSLQEGILIANRVNAALQRGFSINGEAVIISASIGISTSTGQPAEPAEILRWACAAVNKAKLLGRSRYEITLPDRSSATVNLLKLENDLRRGVECGEFEVHYQPIMDLSRSHLTRFEALMRWNHPKLGFIPPSAFIPLAEETGLILPMGTALLRSACRQMQAWNSRFYPPASVCVNISPRQFTEGTFVEQVRDALRDTGLDSKSLELEVTENLTMQDAGRAEKVLQELVGAGISVSLDDFGTGYSSLSYLLRLPIRTLKIDRSFVAGIEQNRDSLSIIQTIIALGHNLGMKVTAEGIETEAQLALLQQLNCDFGQGYLFAPALAPEQATEMFARSRLAVCPPPEPLMLSAATTALPAIRPQLLA